VVDNLVAEARDITYVADGNNRRREPSSLKLGEDGAHSYLRESLLRFHAHSAKHQEGQANDSISEMWNCVVTSRPSSGVSF